MRIATAAPAADDGDDEFPPRQRSGVDALRAMIVEVLQARFGSPIPAEIVEHLDSTNDVEALKRIAIRAMRVANIDDLLGKG